MPANPSTHPGMKASRAGRNNRSAAGKGQKVIPTEVAVGQNWSAWMPNRHQWLLATVVSRAGGTAILKFDPRYKVGRGYETQTVDERTMLESSNLFRFIETAV